MHVDRIDFNGNSNIGLFAFCNDNICLVGKEVPKKCIEKLEKVLKVPVHKIYIAGTSLVGVFLAGNNDTILVPSIAFENELKELDKLSINYKIIDTKFTALGNNILCNDNGAIISSEFEAKAKKDIQKALAIPTSQQQIAEMDVVGSLCALNDKGGLVHRDASETELKKIEKLLKIDMEIGTVNFGSPYIKSAVILNKNGFLTGTQTTGPEIQHADYAFGFLE